MWPLYSWLVVLILLKSAKKVNIVSDFLPKTTKVPSQVSGREVRLFIVFIIVLGVLKMALITLATPFVDLSGSFCGSIATRDKSGLHLSAPSRRINRKSTSQFNVRNAFSEAVSYWNRFEPMHHFQDSWNQAATFPERGFHLFVRVNWYRLFNGLQIVVHFPD